MRSFRRWWRALREDAAGHAVVLPEGFAHEKVLDAIAVLRLLDRLGMPAPLMAEMWETGQWQSYTDVSRERPLTADARMRFIRAVMEVGAVHAAGFDPPVLLRLIGSGLPDGAVLTGCMAGLKAGEAGDVAAGRVTPDVDGWAALAALRGFVPPPPEVAGRAPAHIP